MSLQLRGKYWHYDFIEGGVRHQGSTRRTVRREAERVESAERQKVLNRVQLGVQATTTLQEAAHAWLDATGSRLRDARNNGSRVRKLLGPGGLPGGTQLDKLTAAMLGQLVDRRVAAGNAPATCNRELALVQSIVGHASSRGYSVPVLRLKGIRQRETPKPRFLTEQQVAAVLAALEPGGDTARVDQYHLAALLWDTGARYSEVTTLQWFDVLEDPPAFRFSRTKTDRSRTVSLGPIGKAVLAARQALRRPGIVWVFPGTDLAQSRSYAVKGILRAMDRAGCNTPELVARYGRATVHTLRHAHAAYLLRKGVAIHHVSARLGHASVAMTQAVYGHIVPSDGDSAVMQALDGLSWTGV